MRIIEGFESARPLLSRRGSRQESFEASRESAAREIIDEVRRRGDAALVDYTMKFDRVALSSLEVSREQIAAACSQVDDGLVSALRLAAERITAFHTAQKDSLRGSFTAGGGLGLLGRPLERVGVYVPGGTASYPSTVLMTVIPARVAGVGEIVLTTPPGANGTVPALTLVAADIARVDRVFSVGGAQAIAALAFGTESIPQVDKICGPGNIFVVLAKKLVYGVADIDGLEGPSEVVIIADGTASPEYCAADLLAQAEHDPLATAILITTSRRLAGEVEQELEAQLRRLPRRTIAAQSLKDRGMIAVVASVDEAIELANLFAPEHLCLMVDRAPSYVDRVSNAGCIVVGQHSSVVLGDYVAGPSHVLPTGGTARFGSPLNVADFIKFTSVININEAGLRELGPAAQALASAEGLEAHARAIRTRLERTLR